VAKELVICPWLLPMSPPANPFWTVTVALEEDSVTVLGDPTSPISPPEYIMLFEVVLGVVSLTFTDVEL
jgi:hypothetical protein